MRLGGLILTGGRSRRMGRPKEWLPFGDTTLLGRVATMLRGCAGPVAVVARDEDQQLPPLPAGTEVVTDDRPGQGPLAALRRGLSWLRERHGFGADDAAFVTACDLPFLDAAAVRWLVAQLGDAPLLMPRADGHLQPLTAIYRLGTLPAITDLLATGERSPRALGEIPGCRILPEATLRTFAPELRFLTNVNDPADYARLMGPSA
ncbi:MAG: molybdenum cofactor guanylyltransferase [Planctomycetota bacterium]